MWVHVGVKALCYGHVGSLRLHEYSDNVLCYICRIVNGYCVWPSDCHIKDLLSFDVQTKWLLGHYHELGICGVLGL